MVYKRNIMAMIFCTECGKEVSDQAAACPGCGCPIKKANVLFCTKCGNEISIDAISCPACGAPTQKFLEQQQRHAQQTQQQQQPMVFMNAGGASSSTSSSSAVSSGGNTGAKPPYPVNRVFVHILLLIFTYGIGNIIYFLYIKNKQKQWHMRYN